MALDQFPCLRVSWAKPEGRKLATGPYTCWSDRAFCDSHTKALGGRLTLDACQRLLSHDQDKLERYLPSVTGARGLHDVFLQLARYQNSQRETGKM
jgi:hypothetical protein